MGLHLRSYRGGALTLARPFLRVGLLPLWGSTVPNKQHDAVKVIFAATRADPFHIQRCTADQAWSIIQIELQRKRRWKPTTAAF